MGEWMGWLVPIAAFLLIGISASLYLHRIRLPREETAAGVAALAGMRPIVEIQFSDFTNQAMDQIVNQAAKMRYMSNGQVGVPAVFRGPGGSSSRSRAGRKRPSGMRAISDPSPHPKSTTV